MQNDNCPIGPVVNSAGEYRWYSGETPPEIEESGEPWLRETAESVWRWGKTRERPSASRLPEDGSTIPKTQDVSEGLIILSILSPSFCDQWGQPLRTAQVGSLAPWLVAGLGP